MDWDEFQDDMSDVANIYGAHQRGETNRLLREQAAELKSRPECWHCLEKVKRGARLCPHCRTELKWQEVAGEKLTPDEAQQRKRAAEAKRQAAAEKKRIEKEKKRIEKEERERHEAYKKSLKAAYGKTEVSIASFAGEMQLFSVFGCMIIGFGCVLSFTVAWLLGFVGWSPAWWTQMNSLEVLGLITLPLANFYIVAFVAFGATGPSLDNMNILPRLDPKGKSRGFDFFLTRVDVVVASLQAACLLFILTFTLLGIFGYAPEWWTTLSKVNYYGMLLGPMAVSVIYMAITGPVAAYVRNNSEPSKAVKPASTKGQSTGKGEFGEKLGETPKSKYFIRRDATIKGPFTAAQIVDLVRKKRLKTSDEVGVSQTGKFSPLQMVYSEIKQVANQ